VMFDVGRSVWLGGERFGGPVFVGGLVDRVVVHYPGGRESWVPPRDVGGFVLGMHRDWLRRKGFSLGYNAVVVDSVGHADDGRVFEVRGFDFRCAANAGVNERSFAVLFLQGSGRFPSDGAVEAMRRLVVGVEGRLGRGLDIVGHNGSGGSTRTLCPGAGLERALRENVFRVGPVPVPVVEGDVMIAIYKPTFAGANASTAWVAVFQSGVVRRAVNADVRLAERTGVPVVDLDSAEQHRYLVSIFPKG
jgi:hypothetical protein